MAKAKRQPRPDRFYARHLPRPQHHVVIIRDLTNVLGPLHVHEDDAEFVVAALNAKND